MFGALVYFKPLSNKKFSASDKFLEDTLIFTAVLHLREGESERNLGIVFSGCLLVLKLRETCCVGQIGV